MYEYNEIVPRTYIVLDGEPYECIASHVFRKQQRKPVNQTKLKNLITGKVVEHAFHVSEKAEKANITGKKVVYLYNTKGAYWFCDEKDKSNRFSIDVSLVGDQGRFLKTNDTVEALEFDEKIIGFRLPIKVELLVTEAPPAVKGNTVSGGTKQATLETGATINVPLFVDEGDIVRINTETGEYAERVAKK
ncbi:MAG: elongation factor P [Parcubacteria group bacterium Gr01-1014_48]|nr:MAG: elongation factor P [Parcubacteria group bacterium Greene0416_14]TSC73776.1 MAG: elongation factor P [Parcubacteria group bacterium Gr01-1014_48]TSD08079.1 MAG: elongation factor P [Parcubacteria group bacterium Greene0714_4]